MKTDKIISKFVNIKELKQLFQKLYQFAEAYQEKVLTKV